MKTGIPHLLTRILTAALLLSCVAAASHADAQIMRSLKEAMMGKRANDGRDNHPPVVAHFTSDDGESFVFDESQTTPLIRFDGDDEVFALTAKPGLNGDIVFRDDTGSPVLKATRLGGMTLFSSDRPTGDPVAATGKADAFAPERLSPGMLWQHLARASRRASQALQRLLPYDAEVSNPAAGDLFADAATVTTDAIVRVALQSQGRHVLDNVHEVHFVEGRPPSATMENGVLVLKLDVSRGCWGGHPSSKRIINVIQTSFSIADNDHR